MAYALENALYQWEEGERNVRSAEPQRQPTLERAVGQVLAELRRRLGGAFDVRELAEFYGRGTDWALDVASTAAGQEATVVDAAFNRYASEATDYAGGRPHLRRTKPSE